MGSHSTMKERSQRAYIRVDCVSKAAAAAKKRLQKKSSFLNEHCAFRRLTRAPNDGKIVPVTRPHKAGIKSPQLSPSIILCPALNYLHLFFPSYLRFKFFTFFWGCQPACTRTFCTSFHSLSYQADSFLVDNGSRWLDSVCKSVAFVAFPISLAMSAYLPADYAGPPADC